jgi:hypothetical protein
MATDFLDAIKTLGEFSNWLEDWSANGQPALTSRPVEVVTQRIESRGMTEKDYLNDLAERVKRVKRGKREFRDALEKAAKCFDFESGLNFGEEWKRQILAFLSEKESEIARDDDDLRKVELELERLREAAKWTVVREAEPARVRI